MTDPNIASLTTEQKLKMVVERAAKLLPGEVGDQLLELVSPAALATMVGVVVVWAGSHFFGIGEIADIALLVIGYAALGGVAIEGAKELMAFIQTTLNAQTPAELDQAAQNLVRAVSLLGVQLILTLLLKKQPAGTFKNSYSRMTPLPPYAQAFPRPLPRNGAFYYRPKITFPRDLFIGEGRTNPLGDTRIGVAPVPGPDFRIATREAAYHEAVHRFLAPKMYLLRELRMYLWQGGYRRSFLLRYFEEALAETYAKVRVHGWSKENLFAGLKFPLQPGYEITFEALGAEAKGILLGPVRVGGMTYNVYYGLRDPQ
jgi:hypothetical protein